MRVCVDDVCVDDVCVWLERLLVSWLSVSLMDPRDAPQAVRLQGNLLGPFTGPEDVFVSSCFQKIEKVPEGKPAEYTQKAGWEWVGFVLLVEGLLFGSLFLGNTCKEASGQKTGEWWLTLLQSR